MSLEDMRDALEWAYMQDIDAPEKAVLVRLAFHADCAFTCYPGAASIVAATGFSMSSVRRALSNLEKSGKITIRPQKKESGGTATNHYTLHVDVSALDSQRRGKRGQAPRGVSHRAPPRPTLSTPHSHPDTPRGSHPDTQTTTKNKPIERADELEGFGPFWINYPNPISRMAAAREFKIALAVAPLSDIMDGLRRYIATRPDPKFVPAPGKWLRDRRWTDEAPRANATVRSNPKPRPGAISLEEAGRLGL